MVRFFRAALLVCGVLVGFLVLLAPPSALAASITCEGDMLATANFDVPAVNEYRLNGSGPGLPTVTYISSDTQPESFAWTLPGPGSWNLALEWRRPPVVPDWDVSQYDTTVVLTCLPVDSTEPLPGPPAGNLYDGRINNSQLKDVAAPVAIYCADGNINIWKIDAETGEGTLVITHPQVTGTPEGGNTQLATAEGVSLYWLEGGQYQVNTPNFEGNLYSIMWQGCDSKTLTHLAP